MTFSPNIDLLDPNSILILRDDRQRRELDVSDLLQSIRSRGVMNPIVVTKGLVLVAGERRLEASKQLALASIPVRYAEDLSPIEIQIVELEENCKRKDLIWQDQARAVQRIHGLYLATDPNWTLTATAERLSMTIGNVSLLMTVAREMGQERIANAGTAREAYNSIQRTLQREMGNQLEELLGFGEETEEEVIAEIVERVVVDGVVLPPVPARALPISPPPPPDSILHQSFLSWAPGYRGETFNLIHCDFPYGVGVFGGAQGQGDKPEAEQYADDKEVYFELLECFCKNFDSFAAYSCHVMFWLSFRHLDATRALFRNYVPSLEFTLHPLIWMKSDNAGIISDSKRDPRHVYEMALLARRGGRVVVKSVADAYSAPSDRSAHASTKPEPMLRHFMSMLCDEHSAVLDPTCGAGSSLRVAESLGAKRVLGLEINEEHVATSRRLLRNARLLRDGNKRVGEMESEL